MITITIENPTPRFTQEVELDGSTYVFSFEWNDRTERWSFSLSDVNRAPIVSGVAVSVGVPLLNRFTALAVPPGVLEAIDTSDRFLDPGFSDLGDRVQIVYTPIAEIPAKFRR